jgi:hypothetical protein
MPDDVKHCSNETVEKLAAAALAVATLLVEANLPEWAEIGPLRRERATTCLTAIRAALEEVPMPWCETCESYHHLTAKCVKDTRAKVIKRLKAMSPDQLEALSHWLASQQAVTQTEPPPLEPIDLNVFCDLCCKAPCQCPVKS